MDKYELNIAESAQISFTIGDVLKKFYSEINQKMAEVMIEGLKRKGFVFENRFSLEKFVMEHCRVEICEEKKQKTYFVDNIPFLLHCYDVESEITQKDEAPGEVTMSMNIGTYSYL